MRRRLLSLTVTQARRVVVAVVGGTILLAGVAMLMLPGPAFIVIPLGLAILATEFVWARWLLSRIKAHARRVTSAVSESRRPRT
ncbi:MAG: PGPGW domain-containing protein [Candidatus Rokubacteria bacterium]|nr:PGPGW domain-containing protein [Candidatus Rokubacteria bacterium]